jgi:hypothetical protein
LDSQGGTGGSTQVQATFDSAMPTATMPTLTGHIFQGYWTQMGGGGVQYYNDDGSSVNNWNIAENSTLYARWIQE